MANNQLAVAAQAAVRAFLRLLLARGLHDVDLGLLAVAFGGSAFIAGFTAPELTPTVLGAVVAGFIALLIGVLLSTVARGRRGIGVVNFGFAFVALVVAIAAAGVEFDPEIPLKLYNLFAGRDD